MNPELELLRFLTDARLRERPGARRAGTRTRAADRRDARDRAGVRRRRGRRLGRSRSTSSRGEPERVPRPAAPARRGDRRDARVLASDPTTRPSRPRSRAPESLALADRDRRRGDRRGLPLAARGRRGASRRSPGAARRCATACTLLSTRRLARPPDPRRTATTTSARCSGRTATGWSSTSRASRPARSPSGGASARRCATSPGCSARSPTRRPPPRARRGIDAPTTGRSAPASEFLDGYLADGRRRAHPARRRGGARAAARGLRAGEGGLRAALRAGQPARLGGDPGRRDRAAARGAEPGMIRTGVDARSPRDHPTRTACSAPTRRDGGVVVRALRPDARRCASRPSGAKPVELELADPAGLFEGVLPQAALPLRLRARGRLRRAATTFTLARPVLVPADARRARPPPRAARAGTSACYEQLGAHVREVDGVAGTAFAVWAPNARSVAVVGDFNAWDGRLHPMRSLGASGIWELFVPGVEDGRPLQVRDPPPRTGSST